MLMGLHRPRELEVEAYDGRGSIRAVSFVSPEARHIQEGLPPSHRSAQKSGFFNCAHKKSLCTPNDFLSKSLTFNLTLLEWPKCSCSLGSFCLLLYSILSDVGPISLHIRLQTNDA